MHTSNIGSGCSERGNGVDSGIFLSPGNQKNIPLSGFTMQSDRILHWDIWSPKKFYQLFTSNAA
jgi:hypothetical protein